jgi:hypothetical protein
MRKRCSFRCSFSSHSPICDPITMHWVALANVLFLALFPSNPTNCDRITNRATCGERASKPASFTYILYCVTITTQILNSSQSSEFAKMRLCSMRIPAKNHGYMSGPVNNRSKTPWVGFVDSSGTQPNHFSGPNLARWQVPLFCCLH